jgi:hypothetical protein
MGTIMTFLCCGFLLFFLTGFQEFLHKHLLYTSSDFFHWVFKDKVHSTRSSSARGV